MSVVCRAREVIDLRVVMARLNIILFLTTSWIAFGAAKLVEPNVPEPPFTELDQKNWAQSVQQQAQQYPDGLYSDGSPDEGPKPPAESLQQIDFYDNPRCTGGGTDVTSFSRKDFIGSDPSQPKLCPSGNSGHDGGGANGDDSLEEGGQGIIFKGALGNCQLNFYKGDQCVDNSWLGYTTSVDPGCNNPIDENGNPVTGINSFNFICND